MATVDANFWSILNGGGDAISASPSRSSNSLWNNNVSGTASNTTPCADADTHAVLKAAGHVANVSSSAPASHNTTNASLTAADADQKFLLDLQQALKSVLSEPQSSSTSGPLANPFVVTSEDTTNRASAFPVTTSTRCASAPTVIHQASASSSSHGVVIAGALPQYSATHATVSPMMPPHIQQRHHLPSPPQLPYELRFPTVQAPVAMIPVVLAGSNQVVMVPSTAFMQPPTAFPAVPSSHSQGTTPHSTPTTAIAATSAATPTMFIGTSSSPLPTTAAAATGALLSSSSLHFQTTGRASKKASAGNGVRGGGTRHGVPAATPPSSSSTPQSLMPHFPVSPASLSLAPSSLATPSGGVMQIVVMPAQTGTQSFASSTTSIASLSSKSPGGGAGGGNSTTTPPTNAATGVARDHGNRPNHGTNVHEQLAGVCGFHPYRIGGGQPRRVPPLPPSPLMQTLPVFVQMFPSEWVSESHSIFQDLITLVCGSGAGVVEHVEARSETSFIAHVKTAKVWDVIAGLRCRVLMDRHGFWYSSDWNCYVAMKEYCESVRRLPQQLRHYKTDGLPCMPLVVELGRMVAQESVLASPSSSLPFDALLPVMGGGGGEASPAQCHHGAAAHSSGSHHSTARSRANRQNNNSHTSARQAGSSAGGGGANAKLTVRGGGHRGSSSQAISLLF